MHKYIRSSVIVRVTYRQPQTTLTQGGCKNATKKVDFYLGVLAYEGTCEALGQAQDLIKGRDTVHSTSELVGQSSGTER